MQESQAPDDRAVGSVLEGDRPLSAANGAVLGAGPLAFLQATVGEHACPRTQEISLPFQRPLHRPERKSNERFYSHSDGLPKFGVQ